MIDLIMIAPFAGMLPCGCRGCNAPTRLSPRVRGCSRRPSFPDGDSHWPPRARGDAPIAVHGARPAPWVPRPCRDPSVTVMPFPMSYPSGIGVGVSVWTGIASQTPGFVSGLTVGGDTVSPDPTGRRILPGLSTVPSESRNEFSPWLPHPGILTALESRSVPILQLAAAALF